MSIFNYWSASDEEIELVITKIQELLDTDRKALAPRDSGLSTDDSEDALDVGKYIRPVDMPSGVTPSAPLDIVQKMRKMRKTRSESNLRLVKMPSLTPPSDPAEMPPVASDNGLESTGRAPSIQNEHLPQLTQFDRPDFKDQRSVNALRITPTHTKKVKHTKASSRSSSMHGDDGSVTSNLTSEGETADIYRPHFTKGCSIYWIRKRDCFSNIVHDFILAMIDLSLDVANYLGPEIIPLIPGYVRLLWLCVSSLRKVTTS